MNVTDLDTQFENIDWKTIFTNIYANAGFKYPSHQEIRISHSKHYYESIGNLLKNSSKSVITNYMAFKLIEHYSNYATEAMQEMREKGNPSELHEVRHEKCIRFVTDELHYITERIFADMNLDRDDLLLIHRMFNEIKSSYEGYVKFIDWMDDETKEVAAKKLSDNSLVLYFVQ
ncbi:hypothetical protein B4U80_12317 [Leptotrombidium deliense]|uniref:Peptidase M13 N-terminal domain-containing protein n=1 Tax=Leptotrombidium deliense TaxID=299467 RepID=A0A443RVC9_9ACAR|nr:hypothetical protein B4U80_12317 [Leptotrombidium deliense]